MENYGNSIVDNYIQDMLQVALVEEAMEYINDGFPLDDDIKQRLKEAGIDPERFEDTHKHKIDT